MTSLNNTTSKNLNLSELKETKQTSTIENQNFINDTYNKHFSAFYNPSNPGKPDEVYIPEWFIRAGYNHPKFQIRAFIANNKYTPDSYLEKLAIDPSLVVRKAVAANQNISLELIKQLAKDSHCHVKLALVKKKNIPQNICLSILEALAESPCEYIRRSVAQNSHTPTSILKKLTEDSDKDVRIEATRKMLTNCFMKTASR